MERKTKEIFPAIYYWGVWPGEGSGHGLHDRDGNVVRFKELERTPPWTEGLIDSNWLSENIGGVKQPEGIATVITCADWSALAFWDRSGDDRFHSRSVFVADGQRGFKSLLSLAKRAFPAVFERIKFEIVPWNEALKQSSLLSDGIGARNDKMAQSAGSEGYE